MFSSFQPVSEDEVDSIDSFHENDNNDYSSIATDENNAVMDKSVQLNARKNFVIQDGF